MKFPYFLIELEEIPGCLMGRLLFVSVVDTPFPTNSPDVYRSGSVQSVLYINSGLRKPLINRNFKVALKEDFDYNPLQIHDDGHLRGFQTSV